MNEGIERHRKVITHRSRGGKIRMAYRNKRNYSLGTIEVSFWVFYSTLQNNKDKPVPQGVIEDWPVSDSLHPLFRSYFLKRPSVC